MEINILFFLLQTLHILASDHSPFQLINKATGFCLVKNNNICNKIRWTTSDRFLVPQMKKCLGAKGKSVQSEILLYDCNENSDLQKWECVNETLLALKGQKLYIELTADNTAVLSSTAGERSNLTILGTSSGACTRTYRELYSIDGNAAGQPCMFPFQYQHRWYSDCTTVDSPRRPWCAVETQYEVNERWGYCPDTAKGEWIQHPTTGAYYQFNMFAALTWHQAESSCKQEGASLLSITDPHEQAYVTVQIGEAGNKLWTGLVLAPDGWQWSNGKPYRYMKWDSGHPLPDSGFNCAYVDPAVRYSWQSSPCSKKLGYICYSEESAALPTEAVGTGFCPRPWIAYNGHCFYLNRTQKTWTDAQRDCRNRGGGLVSVHNVEDQSFVISQLGIASSDELWIGLNDRKTEGLFEWADHSTVRFIRWEVGKPAVSTDIKDCVVIRGETGRWADCTCEERHGFICMKMSSTEAAEHEAVKDEGCKTGWRRHGSYCYFIGPLTKTFDEAVNDCSSHGSYLADVSNRLDNAYLVSLVGLRPEKHFWLGLSNRQNSNQFVWTNTDSVRFTHWNADMPGHQSGCVAMTSGIFAGLWDLLPCTNREKYICKHLAEGAVATPAPVIPAPPLKCPPEWSELRNRSICYKFFHGIPRRKTWYEARDYCTAIGGDLLSIHSKAELKSINGYGITWIGLSAPDPATGYVWSDGSPLQFQYWEANEPDNKKNLEFCVQMNLSNRLRTWSDVHCEKGSGWLCQIHKGVTPKPPPDPVAPAYNTTPEGWLEWKGNQYKIIRAQRGMEEARDYCKRMHSDLLTINSEEESVFVWKQTQGRLSSVWIGLIVDLDQTYEWMDGSPVVFLRWDDGQPHFQNNDENCAVMTSFLGFWHTSPCGLTHEFVCKRNSTPPAHATVPPPVILRGGCPQNWKKFDSKCYLIMNKQNETWDGARTKCKAMGGNLASIHSNHEQVFLKAHIAEAPTTDLWIGMHEKNGQFYWTDGRPSHYVMWNTGRQMFLPREQRQLLTCVVMTSEPTEVLGKWTKKSCNDTNGYICLQSVDPARPDSPEPATSQYVQIFNDSVKVNSNKMTWYAAQKHCKDDGASLASLRNIWSKTYIDLITLNLKAPVWIGLNTLETGGYFRYTEGWHLSVAYWRWGEPVTDKPCVYVDVDGLWRTSKCDQNMASVCMKSTDVPPTESAEFPGICPDMPQKGISTGIRLSIWLPFRGNCYLIRPLKASWPEASADCAVNGASLASIEDPSEQDFIKNNLEFYKDSESAFWIGLYRTHRGQWLWLDRRAVDYTKWDLGEPNERQYAALEVSSGKWITETSRRRGFICKTPKVLKETPTTTASPTVNLPTHSNSILPVVAIICVTIIVIVIVILIVYILLKRSGRSFHVPELTSTFSNPMFFTRMQSTSSD